jgi:hypothetical protein
VYLQKGDKDLSLKRNNNVHLNRAISQCTLETFRRVTLGVASKSIKSDKLIESHVAHEITVKDNFLEWLKDDVFPCEYVRTSIEVKRMHSKCHPCSRVGRVAAADDNQFHVMFMRGTQEEK